MLYQNRRGGIEIGWSATCLDPIQLSVHCHDLCSYSVVSSIHVIVVIVAEQLRA